MAQKSTLKKVGLGVLGVVSAISVIAIGVKLGNVGYKKTIDDLKDAIQERLDTKKDDTKKDDTSTTTPEEPKTSTQAVRIVYNDFIA